MSDSQKSWNDWTRTPKDSQSQKLEQRITELEKRFRSHQGIDFAAAGPDYPHPSQRVRTLYFFEGNGRLDPTGIQFLEDPDASTTRGFYWVTQYSDTPNSAIPSAKVVSDIRGSGDVVSLELESGATADDIASLTILSNIPSGFGATAITGTVETASETAYFNLAIDPTSQGRSFDLSNVPLWLIGETSDFASPSDGMLWYRSDLNRFRARANGVTENLAYESDIPTSSNVQPFAAKTTTYTTTADDGVISVDATSASFTVTLVSASGNAGLTQTFKKITAANVVTIDANGSQTIDGVLTIGLSRQWESVTLVSNGSNWLITGWY